MRGLLCALPWARGPEEKFEGQPGPRDFPSDCRGQTNTRYLEDKTGCSPILIARGNQASESKSVMVGGEYRSARVWPAGQQDSPHVRLGKMRL